MQSKRVILGLGAAALLASLAFTPAHAANPTASVSYDVGVCDPKFPLRCIKPNSDGSLNVSGGVGGGVAGFTAETTPSAVAAGTNKPASEDAANGAIRMEVCKPGTTTCIDLSLPSGIFGLDGSTLMSGSNPFADRIVTSTLGGATPYHAITAGSTNSTLISTGAHTLYSLTLTGLNTTAGYLRLYDTAAAPTCSSATGAKHTYLVIGSATQQGGLIVPLPAQGEAYALGLAYCFTGGPTDTDNTSGPANALINATYQ